MADRFDLRTEEAIRLMTTFAERTGLASERPQQRYLWTDAFAVCNFLALARTTHDERYTKLALLLVDRVHHTLGRHRPDDSRTGWLSGLSESEGEAHPTKGGLRIGKKFTERPAREPFDEQLEWDRDGQYFHYLTKWMHALDQVSRQAKQPRFNLWARELAAAAYAAFSYRPAAGGRPRMVWKMSIDLLGPLARPLVPSMGQHDPLDGFITCAQLQATASMFGERPDGPSLEAEMAGFQSMISAGDWVTSDPLGMGGMLMDAWRVEQVSPALVSALAKQAMAGERGALAPPGLSPALLAAALEGLRHYARRGDLRQPASRRLAFRELGLAIGLHAIEIMERELRAGHLSTRSDLHDLLDALRPYAALGAAIESFWLDPEHREVRTWSEHRDINDVMLATSLVPEGFSVLSPSTD